VLVPGTEADGVADARIEAWLSFPSKVRQIDHGWARELFWHLRSPAPVVQCYEMFSLKELAELGATPDGPPQVLVHYLTALSDTHGACSMATFKHLVGKLLTPRMIMDALLRMAPETGEPRRKAIREIEARVLAATNAQGEWK
jgi:hypothetical protein